MFTVYLACHVISACVIFAAFHKYSVSIASARYPDSECALALRRQYAFQRLLDLSGQGWLMSTRLEGDWKVEKCSEKMCEILGYNWKSETENDVVGKRGLSFTTTENNLPIQKAFIRDTLVSVYITRLMRKSGKLIWCEISGQTVVFSDIGERRITVAKNIEHIILRFQEEAKQTAQR